MAFYVLDENNNKIEAYDKEGFLAFLEDAIENNTLSGIASDSAFVDKLKCCVGGGTHKVAFVTQAVYNQLLANNQLIPNAYYFVTDDTTSEDIDAQLETINSTLASYNLRLEALETNPALQSVTINGENGASIVLDKKTTYVFNIDKGTYTIFIPDDPSDTTIGSITYKSNICMITNNASISWIEYKKAYNGFTSTEYNKLKLYYRNFGTGTVSVNTTQLNCAYYKLVSTN